MVTFGSILRAEDENGWPPPDYGPDNDQVTITFHFGGKIQDGVYYEEGRQIKVLKYDHVPISLLGVGTMRVFVKDQVKSDEFNLYLKDRSGVKCLTEDAQLFTAIEKLETVMECFILIVMKDAINGDVFDLESGSDGDDSLDGLSDFSQSDEEYEYDMGESEYSDDELENVFVSHVEDEAVAQTRARKMKGKKKVVHQNSSFATEDLATSEDDGCVNESDEDLNTGRDSDGEDSNRLNFQTFNPKNSFDPKVCVGMIFTTKKELKMAVQSMAINDKRNVKFTKNDKGRLWAECEVSSCLWMLRGLKMKTDSTFQISKYYEKHNCKPSFNVKNMTSTWLAEKFKDRFKNDPRRDLEAFRTESIEDLKVHISEQQVIKTKRKALHLIEGTPDTQYEFLFNYVEEIKRSNPGSSIELVVDGSDSRRRFDRIYVCLNACKVGFREGCRPVICFDGCWLKGVSGGCLLTACGIDANNSYLPIAWAVVGKECTDSWAWFMRLLKKDLQIKEPKHYTLMSDKQKGLIQAELDEFPGAEYRFCARHLLVNLQNAGFRGAWLKKMFWKAARATTPNSFELIMDEIQKQDAGAERWLRERPPSQWSRAFFREFSRCDILTNNACETFNGNIRKSRERPIITMLEEIHESLMKRFAKNRDKVASSKRWQEVICPRIQGFIDLHSNRLEEFIPHKANNTNFSIKGMHGGQYHVDLKAGTCGCRKWQLSGFPCIHAMSAINFLQADVEPFCHKCYQVVTYKKTYKECIVPINSRQEWPKTNMMPCGPPVYNKRKPGRPVVKRRLEQGEQQGAASKRKAKPKPLIVTSASGVKQLRRRDSEYKCKKCGVDGHNIRTCKKDAAVATEVGPNEAANKSNLFETQVHQEEEIIDLTVGSYPISTQETQTIQGEWNQALNMYNIIVEEQQPTTLSFLIGEKTGEVMDEQHELIGDSFLQEMIDITPNMANEALISTVDVAVGYGPSELPIIKKNGKNFMTLKNVIANEKGKRNGD